MSDPSIPKHRKLPAQSSQASRKRRAEALQSNFCTSIAALIEEAVREDNGQAYSFMLMARHGSKLENKLRFTLLMEQVIRHDAMECARRLGVRLPYGASDLLRRCELTHVFDKRHIDVVATLFYAGRKRGRTKYYGVPTSRASELNSLLRVYTRDGHARKERDCLNFVVGLLRRFPSTRADMRDYFMLDVFRLVCADRSPLYQCGCMARMRTDFIERYRPSPDRFLVMMHPHTLELVDSSTEAHASKCRQIVSIADRVLRARFTHTAAVLHQERRLPLVLQTHILTFLTAAVTQKRPLRYHNRPRRRALRQWVVERWKRMVQRRRGLAAQADDQAEPIDI